MRSQGLRVFGCRVLGVKGFRGFRELELPRLLRSTMAAAAVARTSTQKRVRVEGLGFRV